MCTHSTNYVLLLENTVVEHQRIRAMVFNATFSNISVISWQSALLMKETGLPKETHRPATSYVSNFITWCCIEYTSPWVGFKLTTFFFHFIMMWQSVLLVEETWVLGVKPPTWCKSLTNFCHIITKCCIKYTSPWVGIKITKLVHVCILSVSNLYRIKAYKTSLTLPLFIKLPVPNQGSEQSCICVLEASILSFSTILIFNFGIVPTVWYFLCFMLFVHRMSFASNATNRNSLRLFVIPLCNIKYV